MGIGMGMGAAAAWGQVAMFQQRRYKVRFTPAHGWLAGCGHCGPLHAESERAASKWLRHCRCDTKWSMCWAARALGGADSISISIR